MKHLEGVAPILPPAPARAMYRRTYGLPPLRKQEFDEVLRLYRACKKRWLFESEGDRDWDSPEMEGGPRGALFYRGNCNDFTPQLQRYIGATSIFRTSLVLCWLGEQAHMVLAVEGDNDTIICCSVRGVFWLSDDDHAKHYRWIAREAPGRPWETLKRVSLADFV